MMSEELAQRPLDRRVSLNRVRLRRPEPGLVHTAAQCRKMGIEVGDTIEGREEYKNGWNEARLTLIFCGKTECVWLEETRNNREPAWTQKREATNWTLNCRQWWKVQANT